MNWTAVAIVATIVWLAKKVAGASVERLGERLADRLFPVDRPSTYSIGLAVVVVSAWIAPRDSIARRTAQGVRAEILEGQDRGAISLKPISVGLSLVKPCIAARVGQWLGFVMRFVEAAPTIGAALLTILLILPGIAVVAGPLAYLRVRPLTRTRSIVSRTLFNTVTLCVAGTIISGAFFSLIANTTLRDSMLSYTKHHWGIAVVGVAALVAWNATWWGVVAWHARTLGRIGNASVAGDDHLSGLSSPSAAAERNYRGSERSG